jgi:hypothetical protein
MVMKRVCSLAFAFVLALSPFVQAVGTTNAPFQDELKRVTLYAPNKYKYDFSRTLFSFKTGKFEGNINVWDLNYGSLYVGEEWDWFSVSTARDARSVARDLGEFNWSDYFEIPVLEPFPKLKEGEERTFKVDASGADGADGADGAPGEDGVDGDGQFRPKPARPAAQIRTQPAQKEKRSGVPKVDPIFVKAIVGHMYVMRVVDEDSDFYVLFRVEALERGDNCTISWKRISSPQVSASNK